MANRKAGSGDDGTSGAKRSAAGKKGAGAGGGDAAQAASGGEAESPKKRGTRAASATGGGDTTPESQPTQAAAKRSPAKGASKRAAGGAGGSGGAGEAGGSGNGDGAGAGAGQGAAKGATKGAAKGAAKSTGGKLDLRADLRQFVSDNPNGWGHAQWEGLLSQLGQRGHDTSNPDQIGMQLEQERLSSRLQGIEGVSQQKARSLVERFGTVYNLRGVEVEEIVREAKLSRDVAERIKRQLG